MANLIYEFINNLVKKTNKILKIYQIEDLLKINTKILKFSKIQDQIFLRFKFEIEI